MNKKHRVVVSPGGTARIDPVKEPFMGGVPLDVENIGTRLPGFLDNGT
jgi:hypothetical protein